MGLAIAFALRCQPVGDTSNARPCRSGHTGQIRVGDVGRVDDSIVVAIGHTNEILQMRVANIIARTLPPNFVFIGEAFIDGTKAERIVALGVIQSLVKDNAQPRLVHRALV